MMGVEIDAKEVAIILPDNDPIATKYIEYEILAQNIHGEVYQQNHSAHFESIN